MQDHHQLAYAQFVLCKKKVHPEPGFIRQSAEYLDLIIHMNKLSYVHMIVKRGILSSELNPHPSISPDIQMRAAPLNLRPKAHKCLSPRLMLGSSCLSVIIIKEVIPKLNPEAGI
jgi:hypothetical protein